MSNKDGPKHERKQSPISARKVKKQLVLSDYLSKQESKKTFKLVTSILQKGEPERTEEELTVLANNKEVVKRIQKNKERKLKTEERTQEVHASFKASKQQKENMNREDSEEELQSKCTQLAGYIRRAKRAVIYTGAGISTAASIPDYRGPQGVWTLLQKGESVEPLDLSDAEPTFTHMCIAQLHSKGHVKHVVSQNCDGLHLRSGLPRQALSEVHGNMYIEVCYKCRPHREYIRLFDTTENTGVRRHQTGRVCKACGGQLRDTIVHFGEKGGLKSPYRWKEAAKSAEKSDLILCLGSSLKILKCYGCLWLLDRARDKRPNLVIVNLQWTPKDDSSSLKINGKCDDVLERVMKILGYTVKPYVRDVDPIFRLCTPLTESEVETTSKKVLVRPPGFRNLRSSGICRTPTPSDSDSTTSSSTDSSDIVDVETENPKLQSEIELDKIIDEAKRYLKERSAEHPQLHLQESEKKGDKMKEEIQSMNFDGKEEHKSSIADNFHDYAHSMPPKSEPVTSYLNNHYVNEAVNTQSLSVYRQLLHLHLLQKQLEWLKLQQKNQHLSQTSPGPTHLPAGPPDAFPGPYHNFPGPHPVPPWLSHSSSGLTHSLPGSVQMSLGPKQISSGSSLISQGPCHISQGQANFSSGSSPISALSPQISSSPFHLSPGSVQLSPSHNVNPNFFASHAVVLHPNSSLYMHDAQVTSQASIQETPFMNFQEQFMTTNHKKMGINAQVKSNITSQEQVEMQLQHHRDEVKKQMKVLESMQQQQMQGIKMEDFLLPAHQLESYLKNIENSSLLNVSKNQEQNSPGLHSKNFQQNDLNSTIQKCIQNIINPNQMVLDNSRQIQNVQMQEMQVREIQRQLELEEKRIEEQEIKQNILKDLIGSSQMITGEKKEVNQTNQDRKPVNDIHLTPHNKFNPYPDYSQLYGTPVPAVSSIHGNVSQQLTIGGNDNMFKQPLPFSIHASKQISVKRSASSEVMRESPCLPITTSAKSGTSSIKTGNNSQKPDMSKTTKANKSEIPGFSELVNSLTMCQSCQFLREYGVNKRSCSMCKDLKAAHSVLNTQWMPERQPDVPPSPTKHASPPKSSKATNAQSNIVNNQLNSNKLRTRGSSISSHTYSEKDLQRNEPFSEYSIYSTAHCKTHVSGNSLHDTMDSNKSGHRPMFDLGCNEEMVIEHQVQSDIHQSTSKELNSGSSSIPGAFKTDMHVSSVMEKDTYQPKTIADSGSIKKSYNSEPELRKFAEERNLDGGSGESLLTESKNNNGIKRSHSQSEVSQTNDELGGEGTVENTVTETEQSGKKKKLTRCVSVPGWFGKGLNIKKRRKY